VNARGHLSRPKRWVALSRGLPVGLLLVLLLVATSEGVRAQDASPAPGKLTTSLELSFERPRREGLPSYIAARLVVADGSAVAGERVRIRRRTDVFGGGSVELGRPTTDNAGLARVPVVPREDAYEIVASFGGSEGLEPSETSADVAFPPELVVRLEHAASGRPFAPQLQPLAEVMPWVIGGSVLVVWMILIVVTLVTLKRIRSEGRAAQESMVIRTSSPGHDRPAPREAGRPVAAVPVEEERRKA
jgi:hypothetical protein